MPLQVNSEKETKNFCEAFIMANPESQIVAPTWQEPYIYAVCSNVTVFEPYILYGYTSGVASASAAACSYYINNKDDANKIIVPIVYKKDDSDPKWVMVGLKKNKKGKFECTLFFLEGDLEYDDQQRIKNEIETISVSITNNIDFLTYRISRITNIKQVDYVVSVASLLCSKPEWNFGDTDILSQNQKQLEATDRAITKSFLKAMMTLGVFLSIGVAAVCIGALANFGPIVSAALLTVGGICAATSSVLGCGLFVSYSDKLRLSNDYETSIAVSQPIH